MIFLSLLSQQGPGGRGGGEGSLAYVVSTLMVSNIT